MKIENHLVFEDIGGTRVARYLCRCCGVYLLQDLHRIRVDRFDSL